MNKTSILPLLLVIFFGQVCFLVAQNRALPPEYEIRKRLVAGDMTALPELVQNQSLDVLYDFLREAQTHQFGGNSDKVKAGVVEAIKKIPGHGKYIGDYIEELTAKRNTGGNRDKQFAFLSAVASEETIEQIGRFLFDERDPDANSGVSELDGLIPAQNYELAASALGVVLGDKSPVTRRKPGSYGLEEIRLIQKWWQENHPSPPDRTEPSKAPAPEDNKNGAPHKPEKADTSRKEASAPPWLWVFAGAAVMAGSALPFLRAKRRKG